MAGGDGKVGGRRRSQTTRTRQARRRYNEAVLALAEWLKGGRRRRLRMLGGQGNDTEMAGRAWTLQLVGS